MISQKIGLVNNFISSFLACFCSRFKANYKWGIYEYKETSDDWAKEQELIFDLYPVLREIDFNGLDIPIRGYFDIDIWTVMDMGYGNHLLAACLMGAQMFDHFKGSKVGVLYSEWVQFVEEYAHNVRKFLWDDKHHTDNNQV